MRLRELHGGHREQKPARIGIPLWTSLLTAIRLSGLDGSLEWYTVELGEGCSPLLEHAPLALALTGTDIPVDGSNTDRHKPGPISGGSQAMVAIPDILNLEPRLGVDEDAVHALLELSFLGKESAEGIEHQLSQFRTTGHGWQLDLFAEDLFVQELIRKCFSIEIEGVKFPVNEHFLYQVLSDPPTSLEGISFRQDILRELDESSTSYLNARRLYQELSRLLSMFKAPDHAAQLDINAHRLDIFKQARRVIDWMAEGFSDATSGLARLAECGRRIQGSKEYALLKDLLDFENRLATLKVEIRIGADGEVKELTILDMVENSTNRYYLPPWKRLLHRLKATVSRGYRLGHREIVNRLLAQVFSEVGPSLVPLVHLLGQLEFYLSAIEFRHRVAGEGLEMSLPSFTTGPLVLHRLFNPLLLNTDTPPVPCDIVGQQARTLTLITGPNSGGKTRLLQTLGLTQLLGQSGLFVPAARANLPLVRGLFVSLVENESANQAEGRLGRELMRIRSLFETVGSPSMVILDELCSGTNPAEGTEIFRMVLELLGRLDTVAFISTHFLDFARHLQEDPPAPNLDFLRVESAEDLTSTYQFVSGIAESSLAAATAQRLGVTFEQLVDLIDARQNR
jgi:DNA mismatch repair protein MutS2